MIKYIGSKRRLLPLLLPLAGATSARTALDLFSGTSRVARGLKESGLFVTAADSASYAHVLAETYVATDARRVDQAELARALVDLSRLGGVAGYVTEVFSEKARYFHPDNARRIDAIRQSIEDRFKGTDLYPVLLTSLIEAADRVDSTTGVQMAYLKELAPRALRPLELRRPALLPGGGVALQGDAVQLVSGLGAFDFCYLDPPYNQHQYRGNYHVWETLVRWDAPTHYGVACKREDCRDPESASAFNRRGAMPTALEAVVTGVDAGVVIVSYNDESWLSPGELADICQRRADACRATVGFVAVDSPRYVGARIGIHNPRGERVGTVTHLRNCELVAVVGPPEKVEASLAAGLAGAEAAGLSARRLERLDPVDLRRGAMADSVLDRPIG